METFLELLKIFLPALLVMLTAWLVIRSMLHDDQERRRQDLLLQTVKTVTPVRLQAYERVVLFLERITPESLIMRTARPDMTVQQLQSALVTSVRSEYEHNLSQQIYMSNEAWEMVKNARGTVVRLVNSVASKLPPVATGEELSRMILEEVMEMDTEPTKIAIAYIKSELSRIMG
jgi:methylthioribose-1-phosphate isomerase